MYAGVITVTGFTWEYLDDNFTIPRLEALYAYWRKWPPVHKSAARLVIMLTGTDPEKENAPQSKSDGGMGELLNMFGLDGPGEVRL